jgi:hypothetical protein
MRIAGNAKSKQNVILNGVKNLFKQKNSKEDSMETVEDKITTQGTIFAFCAIGVMLLLSTFVFIGLELLAGRNEVIIEWGLPCVFPLIISVRFWPKKSRWFRIIYFSCLSILSAGIWLLGYILWCKILDCTIVWQESLLGLIVCVPLFFMASELWIWIALWWARKRTIANKKGG